MQVQVGNNGKKKDAGLPLRSTLGSVDRVSKVQNHGKNRLFYRTDGGVPPSSIDYRELS